MKKRNHQKRRSGFPQALCSFWGIWGISGVFGDVFLDFRSYFVVSLSLRVCSLMFSLLFWGGWTPRYAWTLWRMLSLALIHALLSCCVFDWQVYDGENTSSRLLGNYTRDDMLGQVINSTSNRLWLEFNSNASGTNQGFRLTYTSELFGKLQCVVKEEKPTDFFRSYAFVQGFSRTVARK